MKRSTSKDDKKQKAKDALIKEAYQMYLSLTITYLEKAEDISLMADVKLIR